MIVEPDAELPCANRAVLWNGCPEAAGNCIGNGTSAALDLADHPGDLGRDRPEVQLSERVLSQNAMIKN